LSPKGATYPSPGHRPGLSGPIHFNACALKGRTTGLLQSHTCRSSSLAIVAWVLMGAPLQGADIELIPRVSQAVGLGWGRSPLWGFGLVRSLLG